MQLVRTREPPPEDNVECAELLKRILSTFSKEKISSAIYSLIDAKVLCAQKNSNRLIDKRVPLTAQRLSTVLDSPAGREKANQMALADITAPNTTQKRGCEPPVLGCHVLIGLAVPSSSQISTDLSAVGSEHSFGCSASERRRAATDRTIISSGWAAVLQAQRMQAGSCQASATFVRYLIGQNG
ncbi:hypothetical protein UY3_00402 [Chelonia mydas]|uniref:Uncharacterized protein n=1 Tax=Chelonia mydas TaxID=8469 RepID=M7BWY1_CHEMY|nr:hypothetical protein UY3_00402 [Chelonia mydas]